MKSNIIYTLIAILIIGGVVFFAKQGAAPTQETTPETSTEENTLPEGNTSQTQSTTTSQTPNTPEVKIITVADVALHSTQASCWTTIRGKVYDLTTWIPTHPGGPQNILKLCGKDGTSFFVGQHGGSAPQENQLAKFYIGDIAQ